MPYGQKLENVTLAECWSQVMLQSKFDSRRTEVDEFNKYVRVFYDTFVMYLYHELNV